MAKPEFKVLFSKRSIKSLESIHEFYLQRANRNVAVSIVSKIISRVEQLEIYPQSGQVEPNLEILQLDHRYVVESHFKIIYRITDKVVLITDIFDTRQDPDKML